MTGNEWKRKIPESIFLFGYSNEQYVKGYYASHLQLKEKPMNIILVRENIY